MTDAHRVLLDRCMEVLEPQLVEQVRKLIATEQAAQGVVDAARDGALGPDFTRCEEPGCSDIRHADALPCHHDCDCALCVLEAALHVDGGE